MTGVYRSSYIRSYVQVVINANKLAKLVKEKKSKQNWLDYYQLKYSRNPSQRPMRKVLLCVLQYCLSNLSLASIVVRKFHT